MVLFPCSFQGLLTISLTWTLLEVPLDLVGLTSIEDLHLNTDSQFISLCAANRAVSMLSVLECVREITSRLDEMVTQKCSELPAIGQDKSDGDTNREAERASLLWFRRKVAHVLKLPSATWTTEDLNSRTGWVPGRFDDPLDHCGAVWGKPPHPDFYDDEVLLVGQFLAIDRDFLLRDVLGCIPRIRYCITSEKERHAIGSIVQYEERRRQFAWQQWGIRTNSSIGSCSPPYGEISSSAMSGRSHIPRVVLVRNLNKWGDPTNAQERDPVKNILEPLVNLWRPTVLIHLSEEVPREPADELEAIYAKANLVLRPYYHHHSPEFKAMLQRLDNKVVVVPLGYGQGTHESSNSNDARSVRHSGVSAALAWIDNRETRTFPNPSSFTEAPCPFEPRVHTWAFVGRLGVHPSRTDMANVFSNAVEWGPHIRVIDRGGAFAGGDLPPLAPQNVSLAYQRAMFVPSPPGNSPDCFRTYEAIVNGALPLLDGRPTDYAWWRSYYGHEENHPVYRGVWDGKDPRENTGDGFGLGSFPAPLGNIFAWEDEESEAQRQIRDEAGFEQAMYTKIRKPLNFNDTRTRSAFDGCDSMDPWESLLRRARTMGSEERRLRQDLNARWYVGTLTEIRRRVQRALASGFEQQRALTSSCPG